MIHAIVGVAWVIVGNTIEAQIDAKRVPIHTVSQHRIVNRLPQFRDADGHTGVVRNDIASPCSGTADGIVGTNDRQSGSLIGQNGALSIRADKIALNDVSATANDEPRSIPA